MHVVENVHLRSLNGPLTARAVTVSHTHILPSREAVTNCLPSRENATDNTPSECLDFGRRTTFRVCVCKIAIVSPVFSDSSLLSRMPARIRLLSGENATDLTGCGKRNDRDMTNPVFEFQTLIVLSSELDTIRVPSPEKATHLTLSLCPLNGPFMTLPVSASHTSIVLSPEPEANRFPSGEYAIEYTPRWCAFSGPSITSPVPASQQRMMPSEDDDKMRLQSGENATDLTQSVCSTKCNEGRSLVCGLVHSDIGVDLVETDEEVDLEDGGDGRWRDRVYSVGDPEDDGKDGREEACL